MPSLFDDLDETIEPSDWIEVPQALFLSWSRERQLVHCAARDEDAAYHADTPEEAEWYLERAKIYRGAMV